MAVHLGSAPSSKERPSCSNSSENTYCIHATWKWKANHMNWWSKSHEIDLYTCTRKEIVRIQSSTTHQFIFSRILFKMWRRRQKLFRCIWINPSCLASRGRYCCMKKESKKRWLAHSEWLTLLHPRDNDDKSTPIAISPCTLDPYTINVATLLTSYIISANPLPSPLRYVEEQKAAVVCFWRVTSSKTSHLHVVASGWS